VILYGSWTFSLSRNDHSAISKKCVGSMRRHSRWFYLSPVLQGPIRTQAFQTIPLESTHLPSRLCDLPSILQSVWHYLNFRPGLATRLKSCWKFRQLAQAEVIQDQKAGAQEDIAWWVQAMGAVSSEEEAGDSFSAAAHWPWLTSRLAQWAETLTQRDSILGFI
jgi:hypothetical protein